MPSNGDGRQRTPRAILGVEHRSSESAEGDLAARGRLGRARFRARAIARERNPHACASVSVPDDPCQAKSADPPPSVTAGAFGMASPSLQSGPERPSPRPSEGAADDLHALAVYTVATHQQPKQHATIRPRMGPPTVATSAEPFDRPDVRLAICAPVHELGRCLAMGHYRRRSSRVGAVRRVRTRLRRMIQYI